MRLKRGAATGGAIVVEFALEWRERGRWQTRVFPDIGAMQTFRRDVEERGGTDCSEHMRDRRISYTPWRQTNP